MFGIVDTSPISTTLSSNPYSPVENFKRSIKLDPNLLTAFKNQVLWYNWNFNAIATACNQDVEDALHDTYVPSTLDYIYLFKGKQKFMYSVFVTIILTDQEKNF